MSTHRRGPPLTRTEAREEFLEKAEDLWDRFNEWYDAHPEATSDEMEEELGRQRRAVLADLVELNLKRGDLRAMFEINGIPGWRALKAATGVDAAEHLVEYLLETTP